MSRSVALILAALVFACAAPGAGTPDVQARHEGERRAEALERRGEYSAARQLLRELARDSDDPQRTGELLLRACDTHRSAGELDRARRCYRAVEQNVPPELKADARYRMAQMEVRLGRTHKAMDVLEALVIDQPRTEGAETGARYLLELAQEEGAQRQIEIAERLATALEPQAEMDETTRALCAYLWLEAGRGERERGRIDASADALEKAWHFGAKTIWRDELFVARARTERARGQLEAALALYAAFLDDRESSWFVGNYDSPYLGRAAFERAELLEEMGRRDEAIDAYEWLVDEVPESKYEDDAAFAAARLRAARGEKGALKRFLARYPESRYGDRARALLDDGA